MAAKSQDVSKHVSSSLLLQPPRSGFSWDSSTSSALLMPITQNEGSIITEDTGEVDSFVNQTSVPASEQHAPATTVKSSSSLQQSNSDPYFANQFQQSPRPSQSLSSLSNITPSFGQSTVSSLNQSLFSPPTSQVTSAPETQSSGYFVPPTTAQAVTSETSQVYFGGTQPAGPPVGGMTQDYRRKGPLVYAPTPGLSGYSAPSSSMPMQPTASFEASTPTSPPLQNMHQQNYSIFTPPPQSTILPATTSPSQSTILSTAPSQSFSRTLEKPPFEPLVSHQPHLENIYKPIQPHWFYKKIIEKREIWLPFSMLDSVTLEESYRTDPENSVVATEGGRYDVYIKQRARRAIYWEEEDSIVRRCTWFYRADGQNRFVPYEEELSEKIEEHYKNSILNNTWHQRLEFPGSESIIMHNSNIAYHYLPSSHRDEWGNVPESQVRPRVVKRGISDFVNIEDGESTQIDHLVFVIHGVGAVCDMRFRTVVECVDDIRSMALSLLQSHFKQHIDDGSIGRVEFLPVSWHSMLHNEATGIDRRLKYITLSSIPKLRHFINDTVLDIPFYCSPVFCQTIISSVGAELNRLYELFLNRNSNFTGNISVVGHSLGSLILFDILAHQISNNGSTVPEPSSSVLSQSESPQHMQTSERSTPEKENEPKQEVTLESILENLELEEYISKFVEEKIDLKALKMCSEEDIKELGLPKGPRLKLMPVLRELNQCKENEQTVDSSGKEAFPNPGTKSNISITPLKPDGMISSVYAMGVAGMAQSTINFPRLKFEPSIFFALGSPIAMFLTVRGIDTVGEEYKLPTCPSFYNIFHPFDPVAYRMETLIDSTFELKPVLVPHHKGRKRMHLEIKESLSRMGADLKQRLLDPLWNTWNSIHEFARAHRFGYQPVYQSEETTGLPVQDNISLMQNNQECDDTESTVSASDYNMEEDVQIGQLNGGKRIDYVLQEKPIESLNEYLFALGSHACYWESEDTVLMVVKKIYALKNILPTPRGPSASHQIPLYNPALSHPTSFTDMSPSGMSISSSAGQLPQVGISPTQPPSLDSSLNVVTSNLVQSQSQPIGPPPLSGFVKASPLSRR